MSFSRARFPLIRYLLVPSRYSCRSTETSSASTGSGRRIRRRSASNDSVGSSAIAVPTTPVSSIAPVEGAARSADPASPSSSGASSAPASSGALRDRSSASTASSTDSSIVRSGAPRSSSASSMEAVAITGFSNTSATDAMPAGLRAADPAKMTSIISLPRRLLLDRSPSTHLIASTTLLLPQPLGPTMPVMG